MIDLHAAKVLVDDYLAAVTNEGVAGSDIDVIVSKIEEHEFGWVFYYDSRKFFQTQDESDRLLGNAPIIVERETGRLLVTGTAEPVETYLVNYRETGDPHGGASTRVQLQKFGSPGQSVEAIKAIRQHCGCSLAEAKKPVDDCLRGSASIVQAVSVTHARRLIEELSSFGCEARRLPEE